MVHKGTKVFSRAFMGSGDYLRFTRRFLSLILVHCRCLWGSWVVYKFRLDHCRAI